MNTTPDDYIKPWLLSKILDTWFVGKRDDVNMLRGFLDAEDAINSTDLFRMFHGGSYGEGLGRMCSDMDYMYISNNAVVMYPNLDKCISFVRDDQTVLFMRKADCRPGYVHLEIGYLGKLVTQIFMNSIVSITGTNFLSSDIYREDHMTDMNRRGIECKSTGPATNVPIEHCKLTMDGVHCFPCVSWPYEAHEWISRTRVFGWPTKSMIKKIVDNGCHIVPVGDKCSPDTFLQWRISFATAEKYLIHSLSHVQFKVYGLLKYQLNQIKSRLKKDIGDDDILCSYFMKTLIYFAVENSAESFWREENIFVCFRFCFRMLVEWVNSGYCPNYFILANNLFQRKVKGENKRKLLHILCELEEMDWKCLSVGTMYNPSIWELLHDHTVLEQMTHLDSPTELELVKDLRVYDCMDAVWCITLQESTTERIRKSLKLLSNSQTDIHEFCAYFMFVKTLQVSSKLLYKEHERISGNKAKYRFLKKSTHWMSASFGTDALYLATIYYLIGNYRKALELCKNITPLNLYRHNTDTRETYKDTYCGRGYTTMHKMKKVYAQEITYHQEDQHICLPHLCLETQMQTPLALYIPPNSYAIFLTFLCYYKLGDTRRCDEALCDLEALRYDDEQGGRKHWIVLSLLGICYQTKGDNHSAIKAYWDSMLVERKRNPAMERLSIVYLVMCYQSYFPHSFCFMGNFSIYVTRLPYPKLAVESSQRLRHKLMTRNMHVYRK